MSLVRELRSRLLWPETVLNWGRSVDYDCSYAGISMAT